MKKLFSKNLATTTFVVCVLYVTIFIFSRIDFIQKQNEGKLSGQANAAYTCPTGYVEIADFCIQSSLEGDENWHDAALSCLEDQDARLCGVQELMAACQAELEDGVSFDDDIDGDEWEWTDDITTSAEATVMFKDDNGCKMMDRGNLISSSNEFRCCKNRY